MDDRKLLLFFLFSLAILLGWQMIVPKPAVEPPKAAPAAAATAAPEPAGAPDTAATPAPAAVEPAAALPPVADTVERKETLETSELVATFSNRGAQLVSATLKRHTDEKGRPLELVRRRANGPAQLGLVGADLAPLPLDQALFTVTRERDSGGRPALRFVHRGAAGSATKVVSVTADGLLAVDVEASPAGWGLVLGPGILNPTKKELEARSHPRQAVYRAGGEVTTAASAKAEEVVSLPGGTLSWAGLEDNYFVAALVPQSPIEEALLVPVAVELPEGGKPATLTTFREEAALAPSQRDLPRELEVVVRPRGQRLQALAYLGAKEYARLAALPFGLEESLQWGWFGFLARPLLYALLWIHDNMVPNYGWAIMLLTLGIRLVLFPLTWTSQKSMSRMQELQPRMQAIRQKWRGKLRDKNGRMDLEAQRKMNEEMQELFRSEGANPYGGCLPVLAQIPVFFALFAMLRSAVELRGAPWLGWIHDLSLPDPYYLLPIVMGATQIYQQKLTPMSGDPMQRRIMQLFPWMFTVFSLSFPAGLVLYWTVNNIVTIGQTLVFKRLKANEEAAAKTAKKRRNESDKGPKA